MQIQNLYVYPIKSLRGVELPSATLTTLGLPHDRIFMLLKVHEKDDGGGIEYENMHISGFNAAALFCPRVNSSSGAGTTLTVAYHRPATAPAATAAGAAGALAAAPASKDDEIEIPLEPNTATLQQISVTMHESATRAYAMEQRYNDWFSARFGFRVVLAYLGEHRRAIRMSYPEGVKPRSSANDTTTAATSDSAATPSSSSAATRSNQSRTTTSWLGSLAAAAKAYALGSSTDATGGSEAEARITFADCAPYLIASARSLDDLHPRLENGERMDMTKFRPNIVVSGAAEPWEEDYWGELRIGDESGAEGTAARIACVHNCGRCMSVNVDYATGAPGTTSAGTMLKRMQRDRRVDPGMKYSPIFGRYSFLQPESEGRMIRVGDEVEVSRVNAERTVFDWQGLSTL